MSSKKGKPSKGPQVALSEIMNECVSLLKFLTSKTECEPFLEPVDWQMYGLTDYPDIIKNPMDLGSVENRLLEGKYKDPSPFASDVRLVFDNCMRYNRPDSDLYLTAERLLKAFDKKFQKMKSGSGQNKKKEGEGHGASKAEKLKFSQIVNQLSPEQLGTLVEMIQKDCPAALNEEDDDEIEIEINQLDSNILQALLQFAQNCVSGTMGSSSVGTDKKQKNEIDYCIRLLLNLNFKLMQNHHFKPDE